MKKIAAIQLSSTLIVADNLKTVARLFERATNKGASLVALPECFAALGGNVRRVAQQESYIVDFLQQLAQKYKTWIVAGTIPTLSTASGEKSSDRCWSSSLVINDSGSIVARYDKIHLFDGEVSDNQKVYKESAQYQPGDSLCVVDTPVGKVGLSVCYDLRFPELFRTLTEKGAQIICVPSAFTAVTGKAHWKTLLRARAIENQCYVLAPNQFGVHEDGRETWGHSMIVDPWGNVLSEALKKQNYVITADTDLDYLKKVRQHMPCHSHRRL